MNELAQGGFFHYRVALDGYVPKVVTGAFGDADRDIRPALVELHVVVEYLGVDETALFVEVDNAIEVLCELVLFQVPFAVPTFRAVDKLDPDLLVGEVVVTGDVDAPDADGSPSSML